MAALDRYLRTLHARGCWIRAWYPIHGGADFECRIDGSGDNLPMGWGVAPDALGALAEAMRQAGLPVEAAPDSD